MLDNAILETKTVSFPPFTQVNIMPIILGIIITSLLSAILSLNQTDDITSNIMLRHKEVVKCESPYPTGAKSGRNVYHFPEKCPVGWGQIG